MMVRPSILFCSTELSPLYSSGGVGTYVSEAAITLASSGKFDVHVLTERDRYPENAWKETKLKLEAEGVSLHGYAQEDSPINPDEMDHWALHRSHRVYHRIKRLMQSYGFSLIEFPEWGAEGFFVLRNRRLHGEFQSVTIAVRMHSPTLAILLADRQQPTPADELLSQAEGYTVQQSDVLLSPSRFLLQWAHGHGWLEDRPGLVSPYPSSLKPARHWRGKARETRDPFPKTCSVAYFGRLEYRKGVTTLAEAASLLNRAVPHKFSFSFIGADTDTAPSPWTSMLDYLRSVLAGVPGIQFFQAVSREELIAFLINEIDIIVIPSIWENYPNSVIEAGQLPVELVVSDAGGIPDLVKDYGFEHALMFESGNSEQLAERLIEGFDRSQVERLEDINRRLIRIELCREEVCGKFVDLYAKFLRVS